MQDRLVTVFHEEGFHLFQYGGMIYRYKNKYIPADTWRNDNVIITTKQRRTAVLTQWWHYYHATWCVRWVFLQNNSQRLGLTLPVKSKHSTITRPTQYDWRYLGSFRCQVISSRDLVGGHRLHCCSIGCFRQGRISTICAIALFYVSQK